MPNAFSKQELVIFDKVLAGYDDALVASRMANVYKTDAKMMERSGDVFWRPVPFIAESFDGTNMTSNFRDYTQLSVPASLNINKSVPWVLTEAELRDDSQEDGISKAAVQRLSSDINKSVLDVVSMQGSLVVKRTGAATGFDDFALADAVLTESGVPQTDRVAAVTTRAYNSMAGNLASRQNVLGKVLNAYERSSIGMISDFEVNKLDYGINLLAASAVTVTVNGANQYHVPKATVAAANGTNSNVDNRYQNLTVTVSSGTIRVGDAFTIAGVNNIHQISKTDTGVLKTFRVTAIISGGGGSGVIQITPPIISNGGNTAAEAQYKNVSATPANGAAITWLNTVTSTVNPFWYKDSIEIYPGVMPSVRAGVDRVQGTTSQGFQLRMTKFFDINTNTLKFRFDTTYGVSNLNPQMGGIILFNQV